MHPFLRFLIKVLGTLIVYAQQSREFFGRHETRLNPTTLLATFDLGAQVGNSRIQRLKPFAQFIYHYLPNPNLIH